MNPTFYEYIRRFVDFDAKDPLSRLANTVQRDIAFPKQSKDFEELSNYLEHTPEYGKLLVVFDDAWRDYQYE